MRRAAVDETNVRDASEFRPVRWLAGDKSMETSCPKNAFRCLSARDLDSAPVVTW